jgi:hypothetical protein
LKTILWYGVVDDYGDNWQEGHLAFTDDTQESCEQWAENENFHSASIIAEYSDGTRKKLN